MSAINHDLKEKVERARVIAEDPFTTFQSLHLFLNYRNKFLRKSKGLEDHPDFEERLNHINEQIRKILAV